jgi:hypothetical protein
VLSRVASHWQGHHPQPDPGPATWHGGTLPQWLTVIAAVVAFVWTVFIYRRSVADKRKEQPRLVHAVPKYGLLEREPGEDLNLRRDVGLLGLAGVVREEVDQVYNERRWKSDQKLWTQWVEVKNASSDTITEVTVVMMTRDGEAMEYGSAHVADYMPPGGEKQVNVAFKLGDEVHESSLRPCVYFTDGVGHKWLHQAGDRLYPSRELRTLRERWRQGWRGAQRRLTRLQDFFTW